jgi:hypothetical protein
LSKDYSGLEGSHSLKMRKKEIFDRNCIDA